MERFLITLIAALLLFSLELEARGGRRVGGGYHPAEMAHPAEAAHPAAAAATRGAVRPLQRTPAMSRAALNAAGLEAAGVGAAAGAGYDDDQPIEIELPSTTTPNTTNQ